MNFYETTKSPFKDHFGYTVQKDHDSESFNDFREWRDWCWEIWGPSCEAGFLLDWRNEPKDSVYPVWAWSTDYNLFQLYFKGEAELSAFLLKWQKH